MKVKATSTVMAPRREGTSEGASMLDYLAMVDMLRSNRKDAILQEMFVLPSLDKMNVDARLTVMQAACASPNRM